jgi:peptidoglycan LD-endopeptidase LytH
MGRLIIVLLFLSLFIPFTVLAKEAPSEEEMYRKRMELYKKVEAVTLIPWYYLAAIDQYERTIRTVRKDLPKPEGIISIYFTEEQWSGGWNPNRNDVNPRSIAYFDGMGVDGNGDGKAERTNDEDVLFAMAKYVKQYGMDHDNIKIALWNYYKRDRAVSIIVGKAKMYRHFGRLNLDQKSFPLPIRYNYSYKNTWGDARGWGGRRIHEGTDIFADYGVPVLSTCYGIVEMKGWNKYGGWRIGIRDINNTYHYFAHLNGFVNGLHVGQMVEPGMMIGAVGSSGYGPPGTSGKFPPHLHYGMYKYNGKTEWSFDPFPYLRRWEQEAKRNRR